MMKASSMFLLQTDGALDNDFHEGTDPDMIAA